jgi:hypothetical protein
MKQIVPNKLHIKSIDFFYQKNLMICWPKGGNYKISNYILQHIKYVIESKSGETLAFLDNMINNIEWYIFI